MVNNVKLMNLANVSCIMPAVGKKSNTVVKASDEIMGVTTPLVDFTHGIYKLKKQKIFYKIFPFLNPKPITESYYGTTKLLGENSLSPEQFKAISIKTRLKYEKMLHKKSLR